MVSLMNNPFLVVFLDMTELFLLGIATNCSKTADNRDIVSKHNTFKEILRKVQH